MVLIASFTILLKSGIIPDYLKYQESVTIGSCLNQWCKTQFEVYLKLYSQEAIYKKAVLEKLI